MALGDVATIVMGQAPSGQTYNNRGEGMPLIAGAGDFFQGSIRVQKWTTSPTKAAHAGDIVLSIRASIGDTVWADQDYCLGRGVAGIRAASSVHPPYLWQWLTSARDELARKGRGATFPQVNRQDIAELHIPLPDITEQQRIAAILDRADALRAKRVRVLANVDALNQAVFHEMFLAASHARIDLGDVVDFYSGATPPKTDADVWRGTTPWFSPKDLKRNDLWDSADHVAMGNSGVKLRILGPDVVALVVRGMILAHSLPVAVLRVPSTINQDLRALLPRRGDIDVDFLAAAVRARKQWLLARVSTSAHGTRKLDLDVLRSMPIPVASAEEQRRFGEVVRQQRQVLHAQVRQVEQEQSLFASLQSRAFRGEL